MELVAGADLNRDGLEEYIYLDKTQIESTHDITLHVIDGKGNEIWSESANISHAGWNSLFLCEQDGEYFLYDTTRPCTRDTVPMFIPFLRWKEVERRYTGQIR